jgi:hypothetical protein
MGSRTLPVFIQCPFCSERILKTVMSVHLRDTGNLNVRPVDACVVLFDMRNGHRIVEGA